MIFGRNFHTILNFYGVFFPNFFFALMCEIYDIANAGILMLYDFTLIALFGD